MVSIQGWSWLKRASVAEREDLEDVVDSFNELANEDYDVLGYQYRFSAVRGGDMWCIAATVERVHPDCAGDVEVGEESYRMAVVRCHTCRAVQELCEAEYCFSCGQDWEA